MLRAVFGSQDFELALCFELYAKQAEGEGSTRSRCVDRGCEITSDGFEPILRNAVATEGRQLCASGECEARAHATQSSYDL